ncbi:protease modulator HflC [Xylanibacillus composti]|uniref:Protein HflC n=1 Tax=Xylanibacillus composti TaxID=1572762 RepID=A0A8J4H133_9BACL|nr:protease modulator HflC [Xylanibacillus composti]MDT9725038.1 protease modulator HflC [Xylanibacillus composti]GIQ67482.1 protein HflC [Xylanibacillus composti]
MSKKNGRWAGIGVGVVIVLGLLLASMFVVKEGEFKVVLQFGEFKRVHQEPGLYLKIPFIETTETLPKYQKIYNSNPASILTKDKKPILVDNYTVWRIEDPRAYLRTLKTVSYGEQRIDSAVYNVVRRKLSEIEYGEIISENTARGNLNDEITREVASIANSSGYGIDIIDVRIKRTDLPEENKQSVYSRMISDRQSIAARYLSEGDEESQKIIAIADREAQVLIAQSEARAKEIVAEGEEEAAKIFNAAYGQNPEFYQLYRTLDSYKTTFQGEPVIMLPIDSPYARILLGEQ